MPPLRSFTARNALASISVTRLPSIAAEHAARTAAAPTAQATSVLHGTADRPRRTVSAIDRLLDVEAAPEHPVEPIRGGARTPRRVDRGRDMEAVGPPAALHVGGATVADPTIEVVGE